MKRLSKPKPKLPRGDMMAVPYLRIRKSVLPIGRESRLEVTRDCNRFQKIGSFQILSETDRKSVV